MSTTFTMRSDYQNAFDNIIERINNLKNVKIDMNMRRNAITLHFENRNNLNSKHTCLVMNGPDLKSSIRSMRSPLSNNVKGVKVYSYDSQDPKQIKNEYDTISENIHVGTSLLLNQTSYQNMFEITDSHKPVASAYVRDYMNIAGITAKKVKDGKSAEGLLYFAAGKNCLNNMSAEKFEQILQGDYDTVADVLSNITINEKSVELQNSISQQNLDIENPNIRKALYDNLYMNNIHDEDLLDSVMGFDRLYELCCDINNKLENDPIYEPIDELADTLGYGNDDKLAVHGLSSLALYKAMSIKTVRAGNIELTSDVFDNLGENTTHKLAYGRQHRRAYYMNHTYDGQLTCYPEYLVMANNDTTDFVTDRMGVSDAYRIFHACRTENLDMTRIREMPEGAMKALDIPLCKLRYEGNFRIKDEIDINKLKIIIPLNNENNDYETLLFKSFLTGNNLNRSQQLLRRDILDKYPMLSDNIRMTDDELKSTFVATYETAVKTTNKLSDYEFDGSVDMLGFEYQLCLNNYLLQNVRDSLSYEFNKSMKREVVGSRLLDESVHNLTGVFGPDSMSLGQLTVDLCKDNYYDNPIRRDENIIKAYNDIKDTPEFEDTALATFDMYYNGFLDSIVNTIENENNEEPEVVDFKTDVNLMAINDMLVMMRVYNINTSENIHTLVHDIMRNKEFPIELKINDEFHNDALKYNTKGYKDNNSQSQTDYADNYELYRPRSNMEIKALHFFFKSGTVSFDDACNKGQGKAAFKDIITNCVDKYLSADPSNNLDRLYTDIKTYALSVDTCTSHSNIDVLYVIKDAEKEYRDRNEYELQKALEKEKLESEKVIEQEYATEDVKNSNFAQMKRQGSRNNNSDKEVENNIEFK